MILQTNTSEQATGTLIATRDENDPMTFTFSVTSGVVDTWMFGDGATSTTNSTHTYSTPGYYDPSVLMADGSILKLSRLAPGIYQQIAAYRKDVHFLSPSNLIYPVVSYAEPDYVPDNSTWTVVPGPDTSGVAAVDRGNIQAALNGLSPNSILELPSPMYKLSAPIFVKQNNVWIRGQNGNRVAFEVDSLDADYPDYGIVQAGDLFSVESRRRERRDILSGVSITEGNTTFDFGELPTGIVPGDMLQIQLVDGEPDHIIDRFNNSDGAGLFGRELFEVVSIDNTAITVDRPNRLAYNSSVYGEVQVGAWFPWYGIWFENIDVIHNINDIGNNRVVSGFGFGQCDKSGMINCTTTDVMKHPVAQYKSRRILQRDCTYNGCPNSNVGEHGYVGMYDFHDSCIEGTNATGMRHVLFQEQVNGNIIRNGTFEANLEPCHIGFSHHNLVENCEFTSTWYKSISTPPLANPVHTPTYGYNAIYNVVFDSTHARGPRLGGFNINSTYESIKMDLNENDATSAEAWAFAFFDCQRGFRANEVRIGLTKDSPTVHLPNSAAIVIFPGYEPSFGQSGTDPGGTWETRGYDPVQNYGGIEADRVAADRIDLTDSFLTGDIRITNSIFYNYDEETYGDTTNYTEVSVNYFTGATGNPNLVAGSNITAYYNML